MEWYIQIYTTIRYRVLSHKHSLPDIVSECILAGGMVKHILVLLLVSLLEIAKHLCDMMVISSDILPHRVHRHHVFVVAGAWEVSTCEFWKG